LGMLVALLLIFFLVVVVFLLDVVMRGLLGAERHNK
jgi:hypothetical protein